MMDSSISSISAVLGKAGKILRFTPLKFNSSARTWSKMMGLEDDPASIFGAFRPIFRVEVLNF